jgi:SAM-dependent methyltransferase
MMGYANQEYSEGLYKEHVQARDLKYASFHERIREIRNCAAGSRLLDLGCSCGYFLDVALQEGFDAYGVEFSVVAIAAASEQARRRISYGDVNQLDPVQRASYDVVTAFDIIEHTLDPIQFLVNIKNNLKSRGLLVISTPDTGHFLRFFMGRRWPMLQPFQHTFLFSRQSLRLALDKAGYTDIELMPARKVLTPDYLTQQIRISNPSIVHLYNLVAWVFPGWLRNMPMSVNIGEMMAFAWRRD